MTASRAGAVARFTADWQRCLRGDLLAPPQLADYVPDGAQARLTVLTDLVRIDLQQRWERDRFGKRIAEYRKEFPEVEHSPELADLLCEEFAARRRHGPLDADAFLAEYPDLADQVRDQLAEFSELAETKTVEAEQLLTELAPGRRIGDFDLRTNLGTGVHGPVFLARQLSMQRLVAVRLSAGDGGAPRIMAQLDHPHIVRVFDQRMPDSAAPRLVYMQYLPGGTAADVLAERRRSPETDGGALLLRAVDAAMEAKGEIRPADSRVRAELAALSWPETVAWVGRRLADALDYAGRHGVRHRAIKPSNVLFTAEGMPKLADFALRNAGAWQLDDRPQRDSLPYRSPEELALPLDPAATEPDGRSDIYSLGALLWEMLTGTVAFNDREDSTDSARLTAALEQRRQGVSTAALGGIPADCPAALRRVLLTCLEPNPGRRWRDGAALAQQLDLCLDDRARDLVDPPETSWRLRLRRWRIPLVALAIAVPNALASLYNVLHNDKLIHHRQTVEAQNQFEIYTAVVNLVGFPVATALLVYLCRYLIVVPRGLLAGVRYDPEILHQTRSDTIRLGDRAALIIFTMWMLAGFSFPLVLHGTTDIVSASDYSHFVALHAVSGAIAVTYPFFLVNFYCIRCIYPMFLGHGEISDQETRRLRRLRRRSGRYLVVAASIPLLAVAAATLLPTSDLSEIIVAVRILCIGSIIAFVITYLLFRALEKDLDALERVMTPHVRGRFEPATR